MNQYTLIWSIRPVAGPTISARISVESWTGNGWTEIYHTNKYHPELPYNLEVDPDGVYRVVAKIKNNGRVTTDTSDVIYGPNQLKNRKPIYPVASSAMIGYESVYKDSLIVRTRLRRIQYAVEDESTFYYTSLERNSTINKLDLQILPVLDRLGMYYEQINRQTFTVIDRLSGSSIGN